MNRTTLAVAIASTVIVLAAGRSLVAETGHVIVPPSRVQWGPAPPVLPAGAQIAVLEGNPAEKGSVTMRLKFPANYDIPAHWHSMTERVTVLSGTFHIGMGDKLDRKAGQTLGAGGYVSLPALMHHFAWTTAPTIVQITLDGPFDLTYVNPAENPQTASRR